MVVFPNFKSTFLVFLTLFNGTQNCYKMTDISKEIANFFENKGLTQKDVARLLGTTPQYISAILCGHKSIGKKQAAKLEQLFGLSASWLLTGKGDMLSTPMHAEEGSVQVIGNASNVNGGKTIDSLVELLKRKDEQIDRLIRLLEEKER